MLKPAKRPEARANAFFNGPDRGPLHFDFQRLHTCFSVLFLTDPSFQHHLWAALSVDLRDPLKSMGASRGPGNALPLNVPKDQNLGVC